MEENEIDEALRALAHPARRVFVRACLKDERAAGDLANLSNLSLPTVSEHLKVLRKARLLILNRQGRFWMYRTDVTLLGAVIDGLHELGAGDGA